jgi:hypothetical protein
MPVRGQTNIRFLRSKQISWHSKPLEPILGVHAPAYFRSSRCYWSRAHPGVLLSAMPDGNTILATRIAGDLAIDALHSSARWAGAEPVRFSTDWQGKNADPQLESEVRVLWSPQILYLRFECRYRELFLFPDSDPNGRRDHLWDRDVAEAFLQPPSSFGKNYKEFEVAPNGMWIDLDIHPKGLADLKSGLTRSVHIDRSRKIWMAELAIPMSSLTSHFDPAQPWRTNFYRVEGKIEPRKYMAWQATNTPEPQFHVPEKFGRLRFDG